MQKLLCLTAAVAVTAIVVSAAELSLPVAEYGVAQWESQRYGNHRAVVEVAEAASAVRVHIPWRRRDAATDKAVLVCDASGREITNVVVERSSSEEGVIVFEPTAGPGTYYCYYYPFFYHGGHAGHPGEYIVPEERSDPAWRAGIAANLPAARLVRLEARGDFNRFDPMEVVATAEEVAELKARYLPAPFLLFGEERSRPIKMLDHLPVDWIISGPEQTLRLSGQPGEWLPFQVGVWALRQLPSVTVQWSALTGDRGIIEADRLTCINVEGVDCHGNAFSRAVEISADRVQPMWLIVDIPADAAGVYRGSVTVSAAGFEPRSIPIELTVSGEVLSDHGVSDSWRLSRLAWLNSTVGIDPEPPRGFAPVNWTGERAVITGRKVDFGPLLLPERIQAGDQEILAEPFTFRIFTKTGELIFTAGPVREIAADSGRIVRQIRAENPLASLQITAVMEAEGFLTCTMTLTAAAPLSISDAVLDYAQREDVCRYLMGFSERGGRRERDVDWRWTPGRPDNLLWLGYEKAGLQLKLIEKNDGFYVMTAPEEVLPDGWYNGGRGGATVTSEGDMVRVRAYSGARELAPGDEVEFAFRLSITPFKPIDWQDHWRWRHGVDFGRTEGNRAILWHSWPGNCNINYPLLDLETLNRTVADYLSRTRTGEIGKWSLPLERYLSLESGAVELEVELNFEPDEGRAGNAADNQPLFLVEFPDGNSFDVYWNVDVKGLLSYVRLGPPEENRYAYFLHAPLQWHQGERHTIRISWRPGSVVLLADGKKLGEGAYPANRWFGEPKDGRIILSGEWQFRRIRFFDSAETATAAAKSFVPGRDHLPGEQLSGKVVRNGEALVIEKTKIPDPVWTDLYFTTRELSNFAPELWAFRSLGEEIFEPHSNVVYSNIRVEQAVSGGGHPWLQEHLISGYTQGWRHDLGDGKVDAALGTKYQSRWQNYFLAAVQWLLEHSSIDSLYHDGIGHDRHVARRLRKILEAGSPDARIGFHCGNNYDFLDFKCSAMNNYMEHLPYLNDLWIGEMFDYTRQADYWMTEISGIPFGLTSELLSYEPRELSFHGMLYGAAWRWHNKAQAIWKLWHDFGIEEARVIGYWEDQSPVKTTVPGVLSTVYAAPGRTMVVIAHWNEEQLSPRTATLAPAPSPVTPPIIDENLDDVFWKHGAFLDNFVSLGTDMPADYRTSCRVAIDSEKLYIGFECFSPAAPKMTIRERDGSLWLDDAVEIFIQPDRSDPHFFQFIGNAAGAVFDSAGTSTDYLRSIAEATQWNGTWEYAAQVVPGGWRGGSGHPVGRTEFECNGLDCRSNHRF